MAGKPFTFEEFNTTTAVVQTSTDDTDDLMASTSTWAAKTAVGASGTITGSLQSQGGSSTGVFDRFGAQVDYIFYPTPASGLDQIIQGDRLVVGGKFFSVVHAEDETGVGLSPAIYLSVIS